MLRHSNNSPDSVTTAVMGEAVPMGLPVVPMRSIVHPHPAAADFDSYHADMAGEPTVGEALHHGIVDLTAAYERAVVCLENRAASAVAASAQHHVVGRKQRRVL